MQYIEEPTAKFPEGSECPVHKRVHNSHGWYVCVPEEQQFLFQYDTFTEELRSIGDKTEETIAWFAVAVPGIIYFYASIC